MAKKKNRKKTIKAEKVPKTGKTARRASPAAAEKKSIEEIIREKPYLIPFVPMNRVDWRKIILPHYRKRVRFEFWLLVQAIFFGSILIYFYSFQNAPWIAAMVSFGMVLVWLIAWGLTWFAQQSLWGEAEI